jgi:hypothetical protein
MATKQRSRSRRSSPSRDRGPRYVAPVLDPNWQSPYAPTNAEKHANQKVVRSFAMRKKLPESIGVASSCWSSSRRDRGAVGAARRCRARGPALRVGPASFARALRGAGPRPREPRARPVQGRGHQKDRLRLIDGAWTDWPRPSASTPSSVHRRATPGTTPRSCPTGPGLSFFVTDAMMRDFELIELEGVVAHCLARHRLGLLAARERRLGRGHQRRRASRARRPGPGLPRRRGRRRGDPLPAGSRRGAAQVRVTGSNSRAPRSSPAPTYAQWRWIWFNIWSDRATT